MKTLMKRCLNCGWFVAVWLAAGFASGSEITLEQAERAVGNWAARGGAFGTFSGTPEVSGETVEDADTGAKMHVVRVPGKGFAVTSADDGLEPIVLFSDGDGEFVTEEGNPLWDLLRWDLAGRRKALEEEAKLAAHRKDGGASEPGAAARAKWAELLSNRTARGEVYSGLLWRWMDPLLKTRWNQTEGSGGAVYNMFTPVKTEVTTVSVAKASARAPAGWVADALVTNELGHYPVGCVAVAGGQVMKHWKHPKSAKAKTVACYVDGVQTNLSFWGSQYADGFDGPERLNSYKWSDMGVTEPHWILEHSSEYVSRLLSDIGVACRAHYRMSGTSMALATLASEMTSTFGYANAVYHTGSLSGEALRQAVVPNLDAGAPVMMGIGGAHAVVADAYGYMPDYTTNAGALFLHVNFGWGGASDSWYLPPEIGKYSPIDELVCNVFPLQTGVVLSGRVTGQHGWAVYAMDVSCGGNSVRTDHDGRYHFILPPGTYQVSATNAWRSSVTVGPQTITLPTMTRTVNGNRILDFQVPNAPTVHPIVRTRPGTTARGTDTTFSEPFEITLSCATEGAEIHYTLDGSEPGGDAPTYEGPIPIQDTVTLRAVAIAPGMERSEMLEETYTFNDPQSRDNFADARPISGASGKSSFDNSGYTKESGEPTHSSKGYGGGASAWAVWTAPESGDWTFRLSGIYHDDGTAMNTQLAVYTGSSVSNLERVAANDDVDSDNGDYSSRLSFRAEKGQVYCIAMDSRAGATWPGTLLLGWEEGYVHHVLPAYNPQWLPVSGGRQEMELDASTNWYVVECSDWIAPVYYSGQAGSSLEYVVSPNATGRERTGHITLQAGNSAQTSFALRQHILDFVTTKDAALDRAWRENKRILIIYGREGCPNTSRTMFTNLPSAGVRALLDSGFVLWYSNCDRQSEARPHVSPYSTGTLPTLAIVDPLEPDGAVDGLGGYQSAGAIQSLLQSAPEWTGLPPAQIVLGNIVSTSATATTKIRTWGAGASSATVVLETASDRAFASVESTRPLGTVTQIWTEQEWTFGPPSATETAFCRIRVASGDWSVVSDVVEFVPLGIALDNGTFAFSAKGVAEWMGQTAESHDGVDAAWCACQAATGTSSWAKASLKTSVTGPGRLSFWWKGDGASGWLKLYVDGIERKAISVTNRIWEEASFDFSGTSEHEVNWVLERYNSSSPYYNVTGWVDQVTWTPEEVVPLATALDNDVLAFSSDGVESWLGQLAESHDGVDAARCAIEKSAGTNSWAKASLKTRVTGPGRLSFWWKGDGAYGWLELYVDGREWKYISVTNRVWKEITGDFVDTSEHEIEWVLNRHNNAHPYYNATGWVDQVMWTPGSLVTFDCYDYSSYKTVLGIQGEPLPTIPSYAIPRWMGYTFGGYYGGADGTGTQYYTATGESMGTWDRAGDATLYAKWIPNTYTVTLDRADGTGGTSNVTATYRERLPSITVPTREGYDFVGYYTGQGGTGTRYYNAVGVGEYCDIMSNTVLHAYWFEKSDVTWSYRIANGVAIVTGASPLRGRLEIPATLGGCPVGEIGSKAFEDADDVTEVVIPSSVTNIGSCAFQCCTNLVSVTIPKGVRIIGADSFSGCHSLTSVLIPSTVEEICRGCNGLARTIDGLSLVAIEVDPGNTVYASEDGVLFSKDKRTLLGVPRMKAGEYVIPAGVTSIGSYAFAYNNQLTSVTIPDSVTFIGQSAFGWCWGLTSLVIPDSVTTIAYYAFWNSSLKSLVIPDSVTSFGGGACGACHSLVRLEVPGSWWGTDKVEQAEVLSGCEVVYRGVDPLAVATEALPTGMKGVTYQTALTASGGISPYTWNWWAGQYEETNSVRSYAETGTAQGWQADDQCWDLALPFAFPFFGNSYTNAKINSNGAISFGTNRFTEHSFSPEYFLAEPIIAVLWEHYQMTTGEIYVASGPDAVTIQWRGRYYSSSSLVNVSATLKKDGTIVLKYGEGNTPGGRIGISAGDGATALFSAKSHSGSMANTADIIFQPVNEMLPPGLSLTATGIVKGKPTAIGVFSFMVAATDSKGVSATKKLSLRVQEPKQVTTFSGNGGTPTTQKTTNEVGAAYGTMPTPKWSGHIFLGWFTKASGGSAVTAGDKVTAVAARTLYAHWTDRQVTTFVGNSGKPAVQATTNTIYADYGTFPEVKWSGHALVGWFTAPEGGKRVYTNSTVTLAAARTLYAQWTTEQVTTFKANGGSPATQKTTNNIYADYGAFPEVKYSRHALVGWFNAPEGGKRVYTNSTVTLAAARTLYAQWTTNQVTTFKGNGGTPEIQKTTNAIYTAYGVFPEAEWENHAFLGWFNHPTTGKRVYTNSTVTLAATRTLYAHWADRQVVTFKGNGGTPDSQKATNAMGAAYGTLPVPKRSGQAFLGWFTTASGGTKVTAEDLVTTATARTLYAHWTDRQVTTFVGNGGKPATQVTTNTIYADYGTFPEAKWSGHALVGWFNAPEGGKRVYTNSTVTLAATRTLYAQWTTNQVTTFKGNGGTPEIQKTTNAIYTAYGSFPEAVWEGHVFRGWFNHPTAGKRVYTNSTVTLAATRTLYAQWSVAKTSKDFLISGLAMEEDAGGMPGWTPRGLEQRGRVCTIRFEAEAGMEYEIQWTPALCTEWTSMEHCTSDNDAEVSVEVELPADAPAGFFRVLSREPACATAE